MLGILTRCPKTTSIFEETQGDMKPERSNDFSEVPAVLDGCFSKLVTTLARKPVISKAP